MGRQSETTRSERDNAHTVLADGVDLGAQRKLAHAERDSVRAAYNRAEYLPERKKMMQGWADYLDQLKAGAKVISLHGEAA